MFQISVNLARQWAVCLRAGLLVALCAIGIGGRPAIADSAQSAPHPTCLSAKSDPDGDGWGWENNKSCVVTGSSAARQPKAAAHPDCTSAASDPDGDGWGWEKNRSCKVSPDRSESTVIDSSSRRSGPPVCQSSASDPDGDGYGWEQQQTCIVDKSVVTPTAHGGADPSVRNESPFAPDDITDVILVTGQSNVLGSMTKFDPGIDVPHERVFAWTENGWQVADLRQVWDRNGHPGNFSRTNPQRRPYNNFAFHFGRTLAGLAEKRVPAFIVSSAPGRGIAHWDRDRIFYPHVMEKVTAALAALPHKQSIDGILWHQGETDWQFEGTSDPNASEHPASGSADYKNYYAIKLQELIEALRAEPWANAQTPFICGETRRAEGVNRRLMALNTDADPRTACVAATDLSARADDTDGSHFSAAGLRELGARYAQAYFEMSR